MASSQNELPSLRWGIIGTGMIASWFVADLTLPRPNARATHTISAIGSSSVSKATKFIETHLSHIATQKPLAYGSYSEVYTSSIVDIIYIATPHAMHKQNCLDAIAGGKHVLCEKPLAINAREASEIITAAREKGVFFMEGMWTRFIPLTLTLQKLLHGDKVIGKVLRTFCDFGLDMPLDSLPDNSRLKDPKLGAGSLLDIGIYSLTWGLLSLEDPGRKGIEKKQPEIFSAQTLEYGIDTASSIILFYPTTGQQGILTCTMRHKSGDTFCRIEGTGGTILVSGDAASMPTTITIRRKIPGSAPDMGDKKASTDEEVSQNEETLTFGEENGRRGFYHEADAVAVDIANGKTESLIMPLDETLRLLQMMDKIRKNGGAKFPQDEE